MWHEGYGCGRNGNGHMMGMVWVVWEASRALNLD